MTLTEQNSLGTNITTETGYIIVGGSSLAADFTATPTSGTAPLTVQFTDTSTGSPTTWLWDFGDGTTGSAQNPSHTYTTPGTYSVSLIASNGASSNTFSQPAAITVSSAAETYTPAPTAVDTFAIPADTEGLGEQQCSLACAAECDVSSTGCNSTPGIKSAPGSSPVRTGMRGSVHQEKISIISFLSGDMATRQQNQFFKEINNPFYSHSRYFIRPGPQTSANKWLTPSQYRVTKFKKFFTVFLAME